jgi:hypothetical protein
MQVEESKHNRGSGMSQSYTYTIGDTAENERIKLYGISEG